jgi:hypothetical protein
MSAGSIGIDFMLEILPGGLQGLNQVFDFEGIDIFIIGRGMNEQRSL